MKKTKKKQICKIQPKKKITQRIKTNEPINPINVLTICRKN